MEKQRAGWVVWGVILPSHIKIMINHDKDPYQPTSIMEFHMFFGTHLNSLPLRCLWTVCSASCSASLDMEGIPLKWDPFCGNQAVQMYGWCWGIPRTTVDGSEILHSLRLVVEIPLSTGVLYIPGGYRSRISESSTVVPSLGWCHMC